MVIVGDGQLLVMVIVGYDLLRTLSNGQPVAGECWSLLTIHWLLLMVTVTISWRWQQPIVNLPFDDYLLTYHLLTIICWLVIVC